jgi:hypothetical protein
MFENRKINDMNTKIIITAGALALYLLPLLKLVEHCNQSKQAISHKVIH